MTTNEDEFITAVMAFTRTLRQLSKDDLSAEDRQALRELKRDLEAALASDQLIGSD